MFCSSSWNKTQQGEHCKVSIYGENGMQLKLLLEILYSNHPVENDMYHVSWWETEVMQEVAHFC